MNLASLKPFTKDDPRINRDGANRGSLHRSTIAKKILSLNAVIPEEVYEKLRLIYPDIEKRMTLEEVATIVQAHKAIVNQDTPAYNAIMDSAYGKPNQPVEQTNIEGVTVLVGGEEQSESPTT